MASKMSFLDRTFWITESQANPKHVAGLQLLEKPKGAGEDYVSNLYDEMRGFTDAVYPFNSRVKQFLGFPLSLVPAGKLDMDYHVNHHVIDDVSDKVALHNFVAGLHETWLDRDKPLWQYHLIEDNKSSRYAIYLKVHHMYGDGATLVRWFQAGYQPEPCQETFIPVWAMEHKKRKREKPSKWKAWLGGLAEFVLVMFDLLFIFLRLLLKGLFINRNYMPIPFSGTKTMLTGQVKKGRAVSTVDLDFERVKALSKRTRASVNEILLCCFDIGVHQFLKEKGHSFEKALFTNMPINLRKPGEQTSGNKIAIVPVRLAHGKKDPYLRLRQIIENHRIVKRAAKRSRPMAFSYYTVIIQSFALIFELLRVSDWVKPIANILISNVPGPSDTRYLKDSKLLACYPISTMTPGGGVNITLLTYNGKANVGLVCCNKHITSLESMSASFAEAFTLLEMSVNDPNVSVDDMGEHVRDRRLSVVDDAIMIETDEDDGKPISAESEPVKVLESA